jgi:hypothetical protein
MNSIMHRAAQRVDRLLVRPDAGLARLRGYDSAMFSHVVMFWTDPAKPGAADDLIAGARKYLTQAPGIVHFHVGRMVPSHRPVVDQSYQVGLNIVFRDKASQDAYQDHPQHLEFVEKVFKPTCTKVVVYDFEG